MATSVTFFVHRGSAGLTSVIAGAIDDQTLPGGDVDVVTVSPTPGAPLPAATSDVVVWLDADVLPSPGLAGGAREAVRLLGDTPTVLVPSVTPYDPVHRDPVSRLLATDGWTGFAPIPDADALAPEQFHARGLVFRRRDYDAARAHLAAAGTDVALATALTRGGFTLAYRPHLTVATAHTASIESFVARIETTVATTGRAPTEDPALADAADTWIEERRRTLVRTAGELAKLDVSALATPHSAGLDVRAAVARTVSDVLSRIAASTARLARPPAVNAPDPDPTPATTTTEAPAPAEAAADATEVSILLFTADAERARRAVADVARTAETAHEILALVPEDGDVSGVDGLAHVVRHSAAGWGRAANEALRRARGGRLVLMTDDACPAPGWLSALAAAHAEVVGATIPVSNAFTGAGNPLHWTDRPRDFASADALAAAIRDTGRAPVNAPVLQPFLTHVQASLLADVGGFDERVHTLEGLHLALQWRLDRRGKRIVTTPATYAHRNEGRRPIAGIAPEAFARDLDTLKTIANDHARAAGSSGWRPRWASVAGTDTRTLSIVIPVMNQLRYTKECLASIRESELPNVEILVFDNASTDGTREYLEAQPDVTLLTSETNLGFAPAVNRAMRAASGHHVLLLNNDVVLPKRALERLLATLDLHPHVGILGPVANAAAPLQQIDVPYEAVHELEGFAETRWSEMKDVVREAPLVVGFAMLVRREVIDTIGYLDERFEIGNFEDNDYCLRAQLAGFKTGIADGIAVHHYGSRTFVGERLDYDALLRANKGRFLEKWQPRHDTAAEGEPVAAAEPDPEGWIPLDAAPDPSVAEPAPARTDDGWDAPAAGDLYLLANDRLEKGQYEEAADLFRWTIERKDDLVLAHMGLGLALANLGRYAEAIDALKRCVELEPTFSEGFNNLGVAYHLAGDAAAAEKALETAVRLDPDNEDARANLANVASARTA